MPGHTQGHAAQQPGGLSWLLNLLNPIGTAQAAEEPPERLLRREGEPAEADELQPDEVMRIQRFEKAWKTLKELDPQHPALNLLQVSGAVPSESQIETIEGAIREVRISAWRKKESRSERTSPLAPQRIPPQPPLEGYYGNPQSPGPFESALYPEIEAGPVGVIIEIKRPKAMNVSEVNNGPKAFNRGADYEARVKNEFDLDKPDSSWADRNLKPDAVVQNAVVEVKFTDDFRRSIYNYDRRNPFVDSEVDDTLNQALEHAHGDPPKSLRYYTNDWSLAEYYTRAFRALKLSNFRFIVVPATRSSEDGKSE